MDSMIFFRAVFHGPRRFVVPDDDGLKIYVAGGDRRLWIVSVKWTDDFLTSYQGDSLRNWLTSLTAEVTILRLGSTAETDADGYRLRTSVRDVPLKAILVALGCLERQEAVDAGAAIKGLAPEQGLGFSPTRVKRAVADEVHRALVYAYGSLQTAHRLNAGDIIADAQRATTIGPPNPAVVLLASASPDEISEALTASPRPSPPTNGFAQGLVSLLDLIRWGPPEGRVMFMRLGRRELRELSKDIRKKEDLQDFDPTSEARPDAEHAAQVTPRADLARLLSGELDYAGERVGREKRSRRART